LFVIQGVHTWSHPDLTTLTDGQIIAELVWTMKIIYDVIGVVPRIMRPPYGAVNAKVLQAAAALGLSVVHWTETSADWSYVPDEANTKLQVLKAFQGWTVAKEKSVISLQHDLFRATTLYIDDVIALIRNAGYVFKMINNCVNVRLKCSIND
jgi:peptidoglycan/xylan/chitin deacetylase (PgdA/CDA1 family)